MSLAWAIWTPLSLYIQKMCLTRISTLKTPTRHDIYLAQTTTLWVAVRNIVMKIIMWKGAFRSNFVDFWVFTLWSFLGGWSLGGAHSSKWLLRCLPWFLQYSTQLSVIPTKYKRVYFRTFTRRPVKWCCGIPTYFGRPDRGRRQGNWFCFVCYLCCYLEVSTYFVFRCSVISS